MGMIEQIARAIIISSAGERAADHAQEFDTGNWANAKRAAQAVLPFIAAAVLAERERCVEAQRYAATVMHELSQAKAEIRTLRDCIVTYGDRVRMATAADMTMQQAIDRAFDREP